MRYSVERSVQGWHQELKRGDHVVATGTRFQMENERAFRAEQDRLKSLSPLDRLSHHLKGAASARGG